MPKESTHPTTRGAEWLCEALADLTERLGQPLTLDGMEELLSEVRRVVYALNRCADALEQLAAQGETPEEV